MARFSLFRALLLANVAMFATAAVIPRAPQGTQFITGPCASDADCALGCCGFNTGKCAGPVIAQDRDGGCGFGDAAPNNRAAQLIQGPNASAAPGVINGGGAAVVVAAPATGSGKPPGTQFITGACGSDGDCASGCCNAATALCAARLVAEEGAGCGFNGAPVASAPAPAPAPATGSGKPPGTQFITGACGSDGDCASGCCNAATALCAARLVAEEGAGCGFNGAPVASVAASAPAPATGSGKPPGTQFITGVCGSDGDCASGCCNAATALCAARLVAEEGAGCGFNGAPVASAPAPAPATGSGKPPGTQFITGVCGSDGDCASGCCNAATALCAARLVAEEGAGCGFNGAPVAKRV